MYSKIISCGVLGIDGKKEGSSFDLAIAMGILTSSGYIDQSAVSKSMFIGELALDGEIKPVKGILPMAVCAHRNGIRFLFLPEANAREASVVKELHVIPVKDLRETAAIIKGETEIKYFEDDGSETVPVCSDTVDFADVKGQENVKRALEVAASGAHNCLMLGSPGCGKTMLARRLPTILPSMTFEEALEVTKIHSIAGILPKGVSLVNTRPFRSPHHSISDTGLVGGGSIPKPGEISLAHYGVLFLDELPEFSKKALEALRQPLEDGVITISRVANPCRCGYFLDQPGKCTCTPKQIQQYLSRLSGPLLDRLDIHIEVSPVKYTELESDKNIENSLAIRERVERTRKIQIERYKGLNIYSNSQLQPAMFSKFCRLDKKCRSILRDVFDRFGMSARAHSRILKVARTIADMDMSEDIKPIHLTEAIQYRSLDRKAWNV